MYFYQVIKKYFDWVSLLFEPLPSQKFSGEHWLPALPPLSISAPCNGPPHQGKAVWFVLKTLFISFGENRNANEKAALKPLPCAGRKKKQNQNSESRSAEWNAFSEANPGILKAWLRVSVWKKDSRLLKAFMLVCFLHLHEDPKILFSESFRCCLPRNGFPVRCAPNIFLKMLSSLGLTKNLVSSLGVRCIVYRCFSS